MAPVSTVIKVKFGDALRRFNALIYKEKFNFDIVMLREKICSLFGFTPDVDFTLTYIDEDGDVVTLCDDNDLQDVASQFLDPLRITVTLNTENLGVSSLLNARILEILKYVPEPLHDGLSKLLLFLASETPNSTVVLDEVVETMQMTHLNKPSESKDGLMGASDNKDQQGLNTTGPSKRTPATYLEALTMNQPKVLGDDEDGSSDSKNKTVLIEPVAKDLQPPRSIDLNVPYSCPEYFQRLDNSKDVKGFGAFNPDYVKRCLQDSKIKETSGFPWTKTIKTTNDPSSSSGWQFGTLSAYNECPFKGMMPSSSNSTVHPCPYASHVPPFKRSYNHRNGLDSILQCDGCGGYPITGTHFKSKKKDDYHLCSICFEAMGHGHEADYVRVHDHSSSPVKVFQEQVVYTPPPETRPSTKLDSCFVLDVNVYNGTIMAPSTTFTKIWRMRNNGDVIWPQGSQLLWTGGDWLSDTVSVELEIPADGLPVGQELDIAVDFVAPELPGQYVSYWTIVSPSGQKFGQRVSIYIQVVDGVMDSGHENHFVGVVEPEDMCLDAEPYTGTTLRK